MGRLYQRQGKWWIDFNDVDGIRRRKKISEDKKTAQEALASYEGKVARREHLGIIEESKISFADFGKEWLAKITPTLQPRARERWEGIVRIHLEPFFRGSLRAVTSAKVEAYTAERQKAGAAPQTINAEKTVLRHMMIRAVQWGHLSKNPLRDAQGLPAPGIKMLPVPKGRVRYLEMDQIPRLLDACAKIDPTLEAFVQVALGTGLRKGEILRLTWKSIDWKECRTTIRARKNGEDLQMDLNPDVIAALKSIEPRPIGDALFFPHYARVINTLHNQFKAACAAPGIEDFRIHDLRHTVGSQHALQGTPQSVIQRLLGHKSAKSTEIYMNVAAQHVREAVNRVRLGRAAS